MIDFPIFNLFTMYDMTPLDNRLGPYARPPYGRSKHTVAHDRRAAKKRAAVKRAKARGQTGPQRLSNRARRNARKRRWAA